MFEKLVNISVLGRRDQNKVSVTYTGGRRQRLSSKHVGMFSEKDIFLRQIRANFAI